MSGWCWELRDNATRGRHDAALPLDYIFGSCSKLYIYFLQRWKVSVLELFVRAFCVSPNTLDYAMFLGSKSTEGRAWMDSAEILTQLIQHAYLISSTDAFYGSGAWLLKSSEQSA